MVSFLRFDVFFYFCDGFLMFSLGFSKKLNGFLGIFCELVMSQWLLFVFCDVIGFWMCF